MTLWIGPIGRGEKHRRDNPAGLRFPRDCMELPPIIFEDETLLALDKPSDLPVVPASGAAHGECLQAMLREVHGRTITAVQRMDAETSGVSLWAKTKPALDFVSGLFQSKTARQVYQAFVIVDKEGDLLMEHPPIRDASGLLPETFTADYWLGPDTVNKNLMRVFSRNGGQVSRTEFRVQENFGEYALVEGRPQTNRRHQVRAHLAAAGAPVLNDVLYGDARNQLRLSDIKRGYKGGANERPMIRSLALHLSELTFTHPVSREEISLNAPLPLEFEIALKNLRKFGRGRFGRRS